MTVQQTGSERALEEARIALNKALGMKTMSPELTGRAKEALRFVEQALASLMS